MKSYLPNLAHSMDCPYLGKYKSDDSPHTRCTKCGSLLRPHVVWFGEGLDPHVLKATDDALKECDLCLLVSTCTLGGWVGGSFHCQQKSVYDIFRGDFILQGGLTKFSQF